MNFNDLSAESHKMAITAIGSDILPDENGQKYIPRRFKNDLVSLEKHYSLTEGQEINLTLQEILKICERDWPKISSYWGLQKFLKENYGVNLLISSNKTKKDDEKQ